MKHNLHRLSLFCSTFDAYTKCKILAIPAKYDIKPYAYGFQKDSPYLGLFNHFLRELREKGNLQQILAKYDPPPQVCPDYSGKSLGFSSCFTAFIILTLGSGSALIILIIESSSKCLGFENLGIFSAKNLLEKKTEDPLFYDQKLKKSSICQSCGCNLKDTN